MMDALINDPASEEMSLFLQTPINELAVLAIPPYLPLTCFPKVIAFLLERLFAVEWSKTSSVGQFYLQWISIKAEAIDVLDPFENESPTKGFELLSIDIEGRSFGSISQQAKKNGIPPILVRFASLIAALMTVRLLKAQTDLSNDDISKLMFTQNVDANYLNYPLALHRLLFLFPEYHHMFYFEVNEHITQDYLSTLRTLSTDLDIRLVLDDTNQMDTAIHHSLLDLTDWIKIDFHATIALEKMLELGEKDKVLKYFERYTSKSQSLVIVLEGLGETSPLKYFLIDSWRNPTRLYYQSRERVPLSPWQSHFYLIQDYLEGEYGLFFKGLLVEC